MSVSDWSAAKIRLKNRNRPTIGLSGARGDVGDPLSSKAGVGIPSVRFLIDNMFVVFAFLRLVPLERRCLSLETSRLGSIRRLATIRMKGLIFCNTSTISRQCAVVDSVITALVQAVIFMSCRRRMIRTRRLKGHTCCNKSGGTGWLLKAGIPFAFANKVVIGFIRIFESKLDGLYMSLPKTEAPCALRVRT